MLRIPIRTQLLFLLTALLLLQERPATAQAGTPSPVKPLSIGETRVIPSAILGENRTLNIYLPEDFDSRLAYPVIYLLDGSLNEDFLHITGLVQFFSMIFKMPQSIVVGIANTDRRRDFTFPTAVEADKQAYPTTGGSDKFIRFLEQELQPYIHSAFKTNQTRYLVGQSLGGLLATEILLNKPHLFTHYLIVSPSLWWDNESLLHKAPQLLARQKEVNAYVYISVGAEGDVMEKDARQLATVLTDAGKPGIRTDFVSLPDENHATILHRSIYAAFKLLFPYKQ